MKTLRTFGLATLVAASLLALAGVSQAMADQTALCKVSGYYCSAGNTYAAETALKATSSNVKITNGSYTVTCTESTLEGKTTAASAEPLPGEISVWSLGGCTWVYKSGEPRPCTVKAVENLPASASIAYGDPGNGTVSLTGSGGELGWRVACGSFDCKFRFNPTLSETGGNPASLSVNQAIKSEYFCFSNAVYTATFSVSSPQPMYVSPVAPPSGTVLCDTGLNPCPPEHIYRPGATLSAEKKSGTEFVLSMSGGLGNVNCKTSAFSGSTTAASGAAGVPASISTFEAGECIRVSGGQSCTVQAEGLPYSTLFAFDGKGNRLMEVSNATWRLKCTSLGVDCQLSASPAQFVMTNGSPATLKISQVLLHKEMGGSCPASTTLEATYSVSSPKPLHLSTTSY